LEERGLAFYLGDSVASIEGEHSAEKVILDSGESLNADAVVISSGIKPRCGLAEQIGAETDKGIIVDNCMKTSVPGVWAAGDPASHRGRIYGMWPAAREQGKVAGLSMAGVEAEYKGTPFQHTLKVSGIDLYSAGEFDSEQGEVLISRGDAVYRKYVIQDNTLKGAIVLGDKKAGAAALKAYEGNISIEDLMDTF
jgi:nitrite reductase (NADH) large subunit